MPVNISRRGFYLFLFSLVMVMTNAAEAAYEPSECDEMVAAAAISGFSGSDTGIPSPVSEQGWIASPGICLLTQACQDSACLHYEEPQYMLDIADQAYTPRSCVDQSSPVVIGGDSDMQDIVESDNEIEDWSDLVACRGLEGAPLSNDVSGFCFEGFDGSEEASNDSDDSDFECKSIHQNSRPVSRTKSWCLDPQCKKSFSARDKMIDHMLLKHHDDPIIKCPFCTELFKRRPIRNSHCINAHHASITKTENYQEFMREEKEKISKALELAPADNAETAPWLANGMHVEEIFVCIIDQARCKKQFRTKDKLTDHVCGRHLKRYEFACPVCYDKFVSRHRVNAHLKGVHDQSIIHFPKTRKSHSIMVGNLVKPTMYKMIKKR